MSNDKSDYRKITLNEVAGCCQKPNYKTAGNWMVRTFLRDWAVPCTWLCLRLNFSANQITSISIGIAILAAFFLSLQNSAIFLTGTLLLQIWYYLDHVDGQIARVRKTSSLTGRFFDFMMHHFVHGITVFGCGVYLVFLYNQHYFIYLCGLSCVSMMTFNLLYDAKYKTFFEAMQRNNQRIELKEISNDLRMPMQSGADGNQQIFRAFFSFLHKSNEIHVMMNVLTGIALVVWIFNVSWLRAATAWFYLVTPVFLAGVKLTHIVCRQTVDEDFQTIFKTEPKDFRA